MAKTPKKTGDEPEKGKVKRTRRRLYETDEVNAGDAKAKAPAKAKTKPKKTAKKQAVKPTVKPATKEKEKSAAMVAVKQEKTALVSETPQPNSPLEISIDRSENQIKADAIIKKYMMGAAGIGLVPVPMFDFAAIVALEMKMLKDLSDLYNIPYRGNVARSLLVSLIGGAHVWFIPRYAVYEIFKFFPVLGPLMSAVVTPAVAVAVTKAVGGIFVYHFETGGKLFDFDPKAVKKHFRKQYKQALAEGKA